MKRLIYLLIVLICPAAVNAQKATVFKFGDDAYNCYRIPAIIANKNGSLIAFSEGRVKNCGDFGDVDIVSKISQDGGKTWSQISIVASNGNLQAGNPAPVFDYTDPRFPEGRLFLFYNTGTNSEHDVVNGKGVREVWYTTSLDFGISWSEPINITLQVHKPNEPNLNDKYNFDEDWRHFANTPGHAIQLKSGRILVPTNHSKGEIQNGKIPYYANAFYSDDHGRTFQISESLVLKGSNENTAVELDNGEVLLNARDQTEKTGKRYFARSNDGGKSWFEEGISNTLTDPVCQGSLNKITLDDSELLLLSHVNHPKERKNLVISLSNDLGKTWKEEILIEPSYAAYSDIVTLTKGKVGILYEADNYQKIIYKSVDIKKERP